MCSIQGGALEGAEGGLFVCSYIDVQKGNAGVYCYTASQSVLLRAV
jgi:hypothetical protein